MAIFTKDIAFIVVLVFINKLDVNASMKNRIKSVEMRLNYLEVRVNSDNIQTRSDLLSLEESILNLNASLFAVNNKNCPASEEADEKLGSAQIIAQRSADELSVLKRAETVIGREKQWLRQKLRISEILFDKLNQSLRTSMGIYEGELSDQKKELDAISTLLVNLEIEQENLAKTVQKYNEAVIRVWLTVTGMIETGIKEESRKLKREMLDELLFLNISIRQQLFQHTSCLHGWFLFDKYCYYYDKKAKKTFSSARDYCRTLNAYIADVESYSESKFIYSLTGNVEAWTGVSDEKEESVWVSERTNQTVAYTNWRPIDPDGRRGARCVMLGYKYTKSWHLWLYRRCRNKFRFVCKRETTLTNS